MPQADSHSRLVGWLKVALPLAALALLSTLFLLADRIDPEEAIPYAQVDVEDLARDPRITAPTFAGMTSDGAAVTVTAATARPAGENSAAEAAGVAARLELPGGGTADMTAGEARLDGAAGVLDLSGGVRVETSSGYVVTTERLTARLDRTGVSGDRPVSAEGPAGTITSAGFAITRQETAGDAASYLLVFSGRVRMIYLPGGR